MDDVEWSSAAYVARYCMKKIHTKNAEEYCEEGKLPEFVRMSRRIGRSYYEEHKNEIYKNDEVVMKTIKGNTGRIKPPKAWDKLFENEYPKQMDMIRTSRKHAAERAAQLEKDISDMTDLQKLVMKAEKVQLKASQLPRVVE